MNITDEDIEKVELHNKLYVLDRLIKSYNRKREDVGVTQREEEWYHASILEFKEEIRAIKIKLNYPLP